MEERCASCDIYEESGSVGCPVCGGVFDSDLYEDLSNMPEWEDGVSAAKAGYLRTANPNRLDSDEFKAWDLGWTEEREQSQIASNG